MKPDGVVTAALEPMETLGSNPVNEAVPAVGQEPNQAASPAEEAMPQQPVGEPGQVEPQADQVKETPAAKTNNKTSGDSKTKTTNKATAKTKPGATNPAKTTSGSRPNTSQSRLSNGVSKPQTNGVAKKTPAAAVKKSTPTSAPTKKLTGPAGAPASKSKVGEKKATGASPATDGTKSTTGITAAKKAPSTTTNGVKTSTTAAAAKKSPAPKPASATPTKPSSAASPKPPVSKTTRPTTGTSASPRPATGSSRPPSTSTAKSSLATAKPATPKTSSATTKPAASKPASTTPSGGKPPASQTSRNTTPVKKDVTKPATPASKKPAESPLTRPSITTKSAKPETPKSASKSEVTAKKPTATKVADTKTPNRTKTQDGKPTPSKDASKTSKTAATKTSSPKKSVGSSTPTPVKRGPKAVTVAEPGKEVAAAVAIAAALATATTAIAVPEEPEPPAGAAVETSAAPELMFSQNEAIQEKTSEPVSAPVFESVQEPTPEPIREPTPTPEPTRELTPTPEPTREPTPTPEPTREPTPTPEPTREPTPTPEPTREPTPTPEPTREPTPTPEPTREPTPTPEPTREPTPEPIREPTPEPTREPTPTPEPTREPTPEPTREPTPEPIREPTPEPVRGLSPEPAIEPLSQPSAQLDLGAESVNEPASNVQLSAQLDLFKFDESANAFVPSLGTTVMSPPCSPPGPVSPVREPQNASSLLDMHIQSDPWDSNQSLTQSDFAPQSLINTMNFETEEEKETKEQFEIQETMEEEEAEDEKENLFKPTSTAPSAEAFSMVAQPQLLGASPMDDFTSKHLISSHEKEEAVEKADEEINDDDEEEDEDEEQRRLGHLPSSMVTDMSMSQPSEEFQVRSSVFGGSAGWQGDDLLSGMDSEDVSSCTSSRQQEISDLSSTQHTAILEGTQSSDALVDSSLRGSEGDGNLMGSPNVETLANEEEEDEDEEDERVDDMDLSSERLEEHHKMFQQQEQDENEDDDDVEMHSEGVTESCGIADEDDFNEEERLDNLNRSGSPPCIPPTSSWGQTNPFSDPWAQPASLLSVSSPSPVSDHGAAESETPTLSPAQACLDRSAPSFALRSEQELQQHQSAYEEMGEMKSSAPEEAHVLLAAPAVGMTQPSMLSGTAQAAHSSSETSTPEELQDYDSSSGVESRSDKQHTPVPASVQPDMEQDLGIHLEKGDEEEEAETLPADEVLGTGPPTAPASAPSSPSTSGDEASDTEGEMQINDPDAPVMMDDSAGFESPPSNCNLPALEEDEEAADTPAGEGEEDGGGTTPQSANSVASYGFDCTTSNSNAHSMAESCGKSPGIFSLENEEQLPEEAKDPSLIKELTLPSAAAAQAGDLLGRTVDLMPLGHPGEQQSSLDEHHYMFGGKIAADLLEEDPLEPSHHFEAQESGDAGDSQPPYYSTICDKTDSFLAGDEKTDEADEDHKLQTRSQEDNWNQNHTTTVPIANGHYLALVPGNRRPIDPILAAHFAKITSPPPLIEPNLDSCTGGEQLRRLEQHQEKLREMQHRQEQERQKRQWLEEERLRLEQQKQLEKQRRELLQLQLQQQQQEHRHRRQVLQWQLELEQQYRMQQKQIQQQQQQLRRSPTGVTLSPSSGLCTIYEAMETSDEEDEARGEQNRNTQLVGKRVPSSHSATQDFQRQLRLVPPQELEWNKKVDIVQQLINQTLMLSGDGGCPPLLLLPVGTGGTLSPLESNMWPNMLPQFRPPAATVTSVSSYSPHSRGSSPAGDWTVVEVETQH